MEINEALVTKLLSVVDAGLCQGIGVPTPGQMCVEAAVCYAMDLPHSDTPSCVHPVVRRFKIALNDKAWSSNEARAKGMREVAVAQLGSENIDAAKFVQYVAEQTIRRIVPIVLRVAGLEAAALRCEREGTRESANAAANAAADAANAAKAAADVSKNHQKLDLEKIAKDALR